ncbi:MAG: hypothetical protein V2A34_02450 [Lentisphaerota bacterium]
MAVLIEPYRLRFQMNPLSHEMMVCKIQGTTPKIWRGIEIDIEIGLYKNATEFVDSITNIVKVIMDICPNNNRSGGSLVQKEILVADMTGSLTEVNWLAGAAANCHAKFTLTATETTFDFTNQTNNMLDLWMVFHAVYDTDKFITLGATKLTVEEDSAQLGVPVLGTTGKNWRMLPDGNFQLINIDNDKFASPFFKNVDGAPLLTQGPEIV